MNKIITHKTNFKHGMSNTPEFRTWCQMKSRCTNPNNKGAKNWLGKGIKVCDRWASDFMVFYNDMGKRPDKGYSLDRIDNDGNYEPLNCRWATSIEQNNNRRSHRNITVNGVTRHVNEWCRLYNIPDTTFHNRLKSGLTGESLISKENYKNIRNITISGTTRCLSEWCRLYNIPESTFRNRLNRGWNGEKLISEVLTSLRG